MADILKFLLEQDFIVGSYDPNTNVIHWNNNIPDGGVISNWAHEFSHFMQFNGTSFGVTWNFLNKIRLLEAIKLLKMLPKPIYTPIITYYTRLTDSAKKKINYDPIAECLALWIKADNLMKVLWGEIQTNSTRETISFLEEQNPLFGTLFGNVNLTSVTCVTTDPKLGNRGEWLVPGLIAPLSPTKKLKAFGALDILEGQANVVEYLHRATEMGSEKLPISVRNRHFFDHQRLRYSFNEYAHAMSFYTCATGFIDPTFKQGIRHSFPDKDIFSHFLRCSILCLESLMMPVFRPNWDDEIEWPELHPGWRFFKILNYFAQNPEPKTEEEPPIRLANKLTKNLPWNNRYQAIEYTKNLIDSISPFSRYEKELFHAALDIQLKYPDFLIENNGDQSETYLGFLEKYPILFQTNDMKLNEVGSFAEINKIGVSQTTRYNAISKLIEGILTIIILSFMTQKRDISISDYAEAMINYFPEYRQVINSFLGDLIYLKEQDFVH